MFTNAYKLACATGFKGTEHEFISALSNPPLKDHKMDYGQTKLSSFPNQDATVKQVAPGNDSFLRLLTSLLGPEILEALQPGDQVSGMLKPVGKLDSELGMHYVPDQKFVPEIETFPIPENIQATAEAKTIQNYISAKMIPDFLKQLSDLLLVEDGQERLRQQRRVIERMAKLMKYQAKPETIVPTAIHDEHELAIYKHVVAKQIVSRNMTVADGVARVNNAIAAMNDRITAVEENKKQQAAEHHKANRDRIVDERLTELTRVSATTHIGETVRRLKEIATEYDPEATGVAHERLIGQLLDSLGKRVLAQPKPVVDYRSQTVAATAKDAYKEVLNSVDPKHADTKITMDPSNTRPLRDIIPAYQRQIMTGLEGQMGGPLGRLLRGISSEDLEQLVKGATMAQGEHGTYGMVMHPMDGPMGQGMMSHHFANRD